MEQKKQEREVNDVMFCQCHMPEHIMLIGYWPDEKECKEVYLTIHLCPLPFWKRLKNGIKYIFGHRSKYGDFDEFILKPEDAGKLQRAVDYLRNAENDGNAFRELLDIYYADGFEAMLEKVKELSGANIHNNE